MHRSDSTRTAPSAGRQSTSGSPSSSAPSGSAPTAAAYATGCQQARSAVGSGIAVGASTAPRIPGGLREPIGDVRDAGRLHGPHLLELRTALAEVREQPLAGAEQH